jgi:hypothetical protein
MFLHSENTNKSSLLISNVCTYVDKFSQSRHDVLNDKLFSCFTNILILFFEGLWKLQRE